MSSSLRLRHRWPRLTGLLIGLVAPTILVNTAGAVGSEPSPSEAIIPQGSRLPTALAQAADATGNRVSINGLSLSVPWMQRQNQIGVADYGLTDYLGLTLLNSNDAQRQPVQWFSSSQSPTVLSAWVQGGYRYLDLTPLQTAHGWTATVQGQTLNLTVPTTQMTALRSGNQPWGQRWVMDVSGPTLAQISETAGSVTITLSSTTTPAVAESVVPASEDSTPARITPAAQSTQITLPIANPNARPVLFTLTNPDRVVVDLRADHLRPMNILWAPGLRWRQQYFTVGRKTLPVYWLQLSARDAQTTLRPFRTDPATATGITPLQTMAQRWQAAAAINAGFFNRDNQYPLGAVRANNDWISGPILGRGAVGWGNGQVQMDRLALRQTLRTGSGQTYPIQAINSGYVQAGIGLYTPAWGSTYRPITESEHIVTVRNQQVISQQAVTAGVTVPIPPDGYILALRAYNTAAQGLPIGTAVTLQSEVLPSTLAPFPHIVGGGPLLIRNRNIVLDAGLEQFGSAFARQAAPRSAIGYTASGDILLVAIHNSPAGPGPTLAETAQVMAQLGSVDALNLDGGSSSSLYLGGRLINRHPRTAARVNNGLGLFLP
ncbi:MAG: phosphodiester glycosidase family protein [Leptolyngbya sp.]|nr:phosphodiester glycosidase family protein [Leptolyngbya sp.]